MFNSNESNEQFYDLSDTCEQRIEEQINNELLLLAAVDKDGEIHYLIPDPVHEDSMRDGTLIKKDQIDFEIIEGSRCIKIRGRLFCR